MRRNLIVVRAGDNSLHRRWLNDSRARNFDLLVSYYGKLRGRYQNRADHYHEMTGPRWPAHDWLWRNRRELFDRYDRVAFVCDDVDIQHAIVRKMIAIIREYEVEDFTWESLRLGHDVRLSARLRDTAELEAFLMREFFEGPSAR